MIPDKEIYQVAKLLIDRMGEDASIHAAQQADQFLDQGNLDGQRVWLRVLRAIDDLTAAPSENDTAH